MAVDALLLVYWIACVLLACFGMHRSWLLLEYLRDQRGVRDVLVPARGHDENLPAVAVQLPLYNERTVCARLIHAVCLLDYPKDKLEIQVLDDSTDETTQRVAEVVAEARARGINIAHLRRPSRTGYKAGALAYGLELAAGDFVAIFDADFCPRPDFLLAVMPRFQDPAVGMVQARWGHQNRNRNWLTRAQAMFLDAHFTVEHAVRGKRGRFFNFNGTAGVWRRGVIEEAGGWDASTLTEDLDLSFRAQLRGAKFFYLDDVEVPAELPEDINAFKTQQHRWAKGSVQTARRQLGAVWRATLPISVKLDATLKLMQNFAFLLLALVACLLPVQALVQVLFPHHVIHPLAAWVGVGSLGLASVPVCGYFWVAQRARGASRTAIWLNLPFAVGVGVALSVNNARAVLEGLFDWGIQEFMRTPKRGSGVTHFYPAFVHPTILVELGLGIAHVVSAVSLIRAGHTGHTPFLWLFGGSLLSVSVAGLHEQWRDLARRRERAGVSSPLSMT